MESPTRNASRTAAIPAIAAPGAVLAPEARKVLRNTCLLLALTMLPTFAGALAGMTTSGLVLRHPIASTLVVLGLVIGLQHAILAYRDRAAGVGLLLAMTGVLGWWLGPILNLALELANGMQLVAYAALGTGAILLAMGFVATTSRRDLGFMGGFLFVGMVSLVLAMLANAFLRIPALQLALSTAAIALFSLFLLYDLNRIVRGGERNYVVATVGVYMSLYNVFANLLVILMALSGGRR